jgi:hypothetical protein
MTVKPLNWVSWREARDRMREIWDGWCYQPAHADRAMVNTLRRGHVPHRGEAWTSGSRYTRQPIALRDVVAGLLSLSLFTEEVEYEATEWGSVLALGGYQAQPMTVKRTATLNGAELAWDEFRTDLIRFELPAGTEPARPRGPEPGKLRRYEADDRKLFPVIRRLMRADRLSAFAAALRLARGEIPRKTVAGHGSAESRAKRLAMFFLQEQRVIARKN